MTLSFLKSDRLVRVRSLKKSGIHLSSGSDHSCIMHIIGKCCNIFVFELWTFYNYFLHRNEKYSVFIDWLYLNPLTRAPPFLVGALGALYVKRLMAGGNNFRVGTTTTFQALILIQHPTKPCSILAFGSVLWTSLFAIIGWILSNILISI